MNTGLSAFGERGLGFTFGVENNEIHRKVFLADPKNQFVPLLNVLFGSSDAPAPAACFSPFDSFYAFSVNVEMNSDKGSQGDSDTADEATFNNLLNDWPTIRGGMTVDICYRPMETSSQSGNSYYPVTDESGDYSAQVMSLVGNNFGQNPNSLRWADGGGTDGKGTPITNLTAISKIIPKIEFVQRRIYVTSLPTKTQLALIGKINDGLLQIGRQDNDTYCEWPEGTVLLVGMPTIRRWRFDGAFVAELGVKLAINTYQDVIEDGSTAFVTWNRLYRHEKAQWQKVLLGQDASKTMYVEGDLSQVTGAH